MSIHSQKRTIQINNIPPDQMEALIERANENGATPEQFALLLIVEGLSSRKDAADENVILDLEYIAACRAEADPGVSLADVHEALSKIPGSMTSDFIAERDDR